MPTLTAELPDDATALLRVVAEGFSLADGDWPIWQWIHRRLERHDLDPLRTLWSLPNWSHNYGPVITKHGPRSVPADDEPLRLTVHGIHHAAHPATDPLARGFLAALAIAAERVHEREPTPSEPVRVVLDGGALAAAANIRAGSNLSEAQLHGLLSREPAVWNGLSQAEEGWTWDATRANLSRYSASANTLDYLAVLNDVVGGAADDDWYDAAAPLGPLALPDALDHLNLTWLSLTGRRLMQFRRAAAVGKLVVGVATRDEFDSRCSALADIFNGIDLAGDEQGSLRRLELRLAETLPVESLDRARSALATLRAVMALRAGQQHEGAEPRAIQARHALGLDRFGGDWPAAWERVRTAAVLSLNSLREELEPLLDE